MPGSRWIPFLLAGFSWTGDAFVALGPSPERCSFSASGRLGASTISQEDQELLSLPMFLDNNAKRPESLLDPDELILIAKRFIASNGGIGGDLTKLSEDFVFEGPVVGPLDKRAFADVTTSVDFNAAFPDFTYQYYGFHVDPIEPDRVWYTGRGTGTNTGPLMPFVPEGTGIKVVNPPQVCSITIDPSTKLITRYTIGYVVDRSVGNTGGLGGLYGTLYALGKPLPFPEANPWKMSLRYGLFQKLGALVSKLK